MNILNEFQIFNNEKYQIQTEIYVSNVTLTSPQDIKKSIDTKDEGIVIPSESITYFSYENSIVDIIPTFTIEVLDDGFSLTQYLKAQNLRLHFKLTKHNDALDNIWIIKDYDIINVTKDAIHYRIYCELDCAIPLNTICKYATSCSLEGAVCENYENPYEMAKKILIQNNFQYYPLTKKDEKGNEVDTRYQLPSCSNMIHFITSQNQVTLDAVKYLLARGAATVNTEPPAYLIYNIRDNKGFITTRELLFRENNIREQPDTTQGIYSITQDFFGKQQQMTRINIYSSMGGIEFPKTFYNHQFYNYNHQERAWTNDKVNKFNIDDLLTRGIDTATEKSIFLKSGDEDLSLAKYYQYSTINSATIYDVLKNLELFSSNLQFMVDGNIQLDVGHVIKVQEENAKGLKSAAFEGKWLVTKIKHTFANKLYKMDVIGSRTYYRK